MRFSAFITFLTAIELATSSTNAYTFGPGTVLGVYQGLSTRSGGEAIGADQY